MQLKRILLASVAAGIAALSAAQDLPADHLIITEIGINPKTQSDTTGLFSEYVEIFNPTDQPVSLNNYYLTDSAFYHQLPIYIDAGQTFLPSGSDYLTKFPNGFTLQPGQVAVMTHQASTFLSDFYQGSLANYNALSTPSPLLFEISETDSNVPNADSLILKDDGTQTFSKTNAGEYVVLMHWNGQSDLVQDVDVVSWGGVAANNENAPIQKGGIAADGPDADTNLTDYFYDGGQDLRNFDVEPRFDPNTLVRRSTIEIGERNTVGNGLTGKDESMEWNWDTWSYTEDNQFGQPLANPGITHLVKNSDVPPPFIGAVSRSEINPVPGSTFKFTCRAGAGGGLIPVVKLFIKTGAAYNAPITMTLNATTQEYEATVGPYAEGTHLAYYFEATAGAQTARMPITTGELRLQYFNDAFHMNILADPIDETDIFINEIMYNPLNAENTDYSEYVELYNSRDVPINISGYTCGDSSGNAERMAIPEGSIIPAKGYFVLAANKPVFTLRYGSEGTYNDSLVAWTIDSHSGANPGYNNGGGDSPTICDSNAYRWKNRPTVGFDTVVYNNVAPWPADRNGGSIELKGVVFGPNNDDPANWAQSLDTGATGGSPLYVNQTAAVSDWSIY